MSLLTTIQNVAVELGLGEPSSVIGNTNNQVKQLLRLAERTGKLLRNEYQWPELVVEKSYTTVDSQASYALPTDFERHVPSTHWDSTNFWDLVGPVSPQYWQARQNGTTQVTPRREWRVKGVTDKQFFINPTPTSADAGETLVFEYYTKNWIRPATWAASTVYAANAYTWNDGNRYKTTSGGTSGATAPTHTSGDSSDGGVTWTYQDAVYDTYQADTDVSHIDENLIELGIRWRFSHINGLQYKEYYAEWAAAVKRATSHLEGIPKLNMHSKRGTVLISTDNVPDTGYGD
jgi:hypothetical protein